MSKHVVPLRMRRTPQGFVPVTRFDADQASRYGIGSVVEVALRQPRRGQHHRFFMAALAEVLKAGAVPFRTLDEFLDALKMACGVTDLRRTVDGKFLAIPGSISFDAMDEAAFKEFREAAFALIAERYGVDAARLVDERDFPPDTQPLTAVPEILDPDTGELLDAAHGLASEAESDSGGLADEFDEADFADAPKVDPNTPEGILADFKAMLDEATTAAEIDAAKAAMAPRLNDGTVMDGGSKAKARDLLADARQRVGT